MREGPHLAHRIDSLIASGISEQVAAVSERQTGVKILPPLLRCLALQACSGQHAQIQFGAQPGPERPAACAGIKVRNVEAAVQRRAGHQQVGAHACITQAGLVALRQADDAVLASGLHQLVAPAVEAHHIGVVAGAAIQNIIVSAPVQSVGALAPQQIVNSRPALQHVIAGIAINRVIPGRERRQNQRPGQRLQIQLRLGERRAIGKPEGGAWQINPVFDQNSIIDAIHQAHIVLALNHLAGGAQIRHADACAKLDRAGPVQIGQPVHAIPQRKVEAVCARTPIERVRTRIAVKLVVAITPQQLVITRIAMQHVITPVAQNQVGARAAVHHVVQVVPSRHLAIGRDKAVDQIGVGPACAIGKFIIGNRAFQRAAHSD